MLVCCSLHVEHASKVQVSVRFWVYGFMGEISVKAGGVDMRVCIWQ